MSNFLRVTIGFYLILFVSSCGQTNKEKSTKEDSVAISIYNPHEENYKLQEIIHDLQLIVLEQNNFSYLVDIEKVLIINNNIYVLDKRLSSVLLFDIDGKFINHLIKQGDGPGECKGITGLDYDNKNNELIVACRAKRSILRYSLDGAFLGEVRLNFGVDKIAFLGNSQYAISTGFYSDTNNNLYVIDRQGNIVNRDFEFPKDIRIRLFSNSGILTSNKTGALYSDPLSSDVYQITGNSDSYLKYSFNFGKLGWPNEKRFNHQEFFNQRIGTVSLLYNKIVDLEDYLLFEYQDKRSLRVGIYDKQNKQLITKENLVETPMCNLFMLSEPQFVGNDGYVYSTIKRLFIGNLMKHLSDDEISSNPIFEKLRNYSEEELNPVIIKYKVKGHPK